MERSPEGVQWEVVLPPPGCLGVCWVPLPRSNPASGFLCLLPHILHLHPSVHTFDILYAYICKWIDTGTDIFTPYMLFTVLLFSLSNMSWTSFPLKNCLILFNYMLLVHAVVRLLSHATTCYYMLLYMLLVHAFGTCCCSVAKLCPIFFSPVDNSLPGSSVHGFFQARILEWVAISFPKGSSQIRDRNCISCIGRRTLYHCATMEAHSVHGGTISI